MEIEKAADTGFCYGVRRAIEMLERTVQNGGKLKTLGPIVHNRQVVQRLEAMGIEVEMDLDHLDGQRVAIGTHGVTPQVLQQLKASGVEVLDTTCPFVRRAQLAAQRLSKAGFYVLIFGDEAHAEVQGILGWAGGNSLATTKVPKLAQLPRHAGILSQTTQSPARFAQFVQDFIEAYIAQVSELRVINTICDATRKRQQAAAELAARADLMIVVGGHHSANTAQLARSCAAIVETHHIETAAEIDPAWLGHRERIGVAAGASTADWILDEVIARLEQMAEGK